jgi:hypothetical protein
MTTRAQVQSAIEDMEEEIVRLEEQAANLRTLVAAAKTAQYTSPNCQPITNSIFESGSDRLVNA